MKKEGKMSKYEDINEMDSSAPCYKATRYLIDIIEKQRWAIIDLLINIELAHPEEYDQNRELPSVDKALKLTEE